MAVIELPADPAPNGVEASLLDFGMVLRPATGAAVQRINRAGSRFRVSVTYPPMTPDTARKFIARFQKAKREGLRIEYPLLGLSQGAPGSPVVDGDNPTGTTLPVTGLTPGYAVKEGYWLTLIDEDGNRYLHCATAAVMADASGDAELSIEPPIRAPLADGSTILLAAPTIEGVVVDDIGWSLSVDRLIRGGTVTIEEAA
jgi:hypothetical protein